MGDITGLSKPVLSFSTWVISLQAVRNQHSLWPIPLPMLPMGLKHSPGFAQAVLSIIFADKAFVEVFLDGIAIFMHGSLQLHLHHINKVLSMLNEANFLIMPKKCEWRKKEIPY